MSLQIRRGEAGQRTGFTPDAGEPIWVTGNNKLYIGDGTTAGGINILASSVDGLHGISWHDASQTLRFNGTLSGFTTDDLTEGTVNKYYHQATAQADVAAMFIPYGTPTVTGTISGVVTPNLVTLNTVSGLIALAPITITGSGASAYGLPAGTYWIASVNSGSSQVTLASTLAVAQAGTSDVSIVSTHSVSATTFTAGQGATATPDDSNIAFTYNPITKTLLANVTLDGIGITAISQDTNPILGGNLNLNTHTINGNGSISYTGNFQNVGNLITGAITATSITATSYGTVTATSLSSATNYSPVTGVVSDNVLNVGSSATPVTLWQNSVQSFNVLTGINDGAGNTTGFQFRISRGTLASKTTVSSGDALTSFTGAGYDGANFVTAGSFGLAVDPNASVTSGHVPGAFGVTTVSASGSINLMAFDSNGVLAIPALLANDGSAAHPSIGFSTDGSQDSGFFHPGDGIVCASINGTEKVRIDSGGLRVGGFVKVAQVSGSLPNPPEAGMIVLDGTTFKGYNGSSWVNLN